VAYGEIVPNNYQSNELEMKNFDESPIYENADAPIYAEVDKSQNNKLS
jgi:hypothetical protein